MPALRLIYYTVPNSWCGGAAEGRQSYDWSLLLRFNSLTAQKQEYHFCSFQISCSLFAASTHNDQPQIAVHTVFLSPTEGCESADISFWEFVVGLEIKVVARVLHNKSQVFNFGHLQSHSVLKQQWNIAEKFWIRVIMDGSARCYILYSVVPRLLKSVSTEIDKPTQWQRWWSYARLHVSVRHASLREYIWRLKQKISTITFGKTLYPVGGVMRMFDQRSNGAICHWWSFYHTSSVNG